MTEDHKLSLFESYLGNWFSILKRGNTGKKNVIHRTFGKRANYSMLVPTDRQRVRRPSYDDRLSMAYQPIVNVADHTIFAHEALIRGIFGESAATVLADIPKEDMVNFDAECRREAIRVAYSLGLNSHLSLNISPEAICSNCSGPIDTVRIARSYGFHSSRLIMEVTERSIMPDLKQIRHCLAPVRSRGVLIALDDFGTGYNGLKTLIGLRPDIIKIDLELVDGIEVCEVRQTVVSSLIDVCERLGILVVAEGVETAMQYHALRAIGVKLMQGYLLARPGIGILPPLAATVIPLVRATGG